jgi:hypothetical protein
MDPVATMVMIKDNSKLPIPLPVGAIISLQDYGNLLNHGIAPSQFIMHKGDSAELRTTETEDELDADTIQELREEMKHEMRKVFRRGFGKSKKLYEDYTNLWNLVIYLENQVDVQNIQPNSITAVNSVLQIAESLNYDEDAAVIFKQKLIAKLNEIKTKIQTFQ